MTVLAWMAYALCVSSLVAAGAWLLDRGFVRVGLPSRWIWVAGLTLSLGLPVMSVTGLTGLLRWTDASPTELVGQAEVIAPPTALGSEPRLGLLASLVRPATEAISGVIRRVAEWVPSGPDARSWTTGLWLLFSGLLTMVLFVSRLVLALRARGWPTSSRAKTTFRISPGLGPAALGLFRPEIVVPRWALSLPPSDLSLILEHEHEHVRGRDPLLLAAGVLPVLAAPWNPVLWWQLRRLRAAVEVDADRRVLGRGASAASYGRLLLELESRGRPELLAVPAMSGTPSLLERRLSAMKKRTRRQTIPQAVVALVATIGLVAVACETEPPLDADGTSDAPAAEAESPVGASVRLSESPLIFVDGVEAETADPLDRLDPEDIASIEVIKGGAATTMWGERARGGVIQITTKAAAEPAPVPAPQAAPEPESAPTPAPEPDAAPQDIVAEPTFTPYEVAPEILNRAVVQQALTREYPPALRDAGIGGRVIIQIFIDERGVVGQALIAESSGNQDLDEAAIRVARVFEFEPAQNRGEPVAVWIQVPVTFESR